MVSIDPDDASFNLFGNTVGLSEIIGPNRCSQCKCGTVRDTDDLGFRVAPCEGNDRAKNFVAGQIGLGVCLDECWLEEESLRVDSLTAADNLSTLRNGATHELSASFYRSL